ETAEGVLAGRTGNRGVTRRPSGGSSPRGEERSPGRKRFPAGDSPTVGRVIAPTANLKESERVRTFAVVPDQAEEGQDGRAARQGLLQDPQGGDGRGAERRRGPQGEHAPEGGDRSRPGGEPAVGESRAVDREG